MKKTSFLIESIYWLHLIIIILWFGLFFIPSCLWPGKTAFHFWFIMIITGVQFLWGLFMMPYTRRIGIICPLTTVMQKLRGFPIISMENLGHSYIVEILKRFNIKLSHKVIDIILLITIVIVSIQYITL
jgi:hypothetical protein